MNALFQYRINEGLTRQALAERLSVDPATVWRWETGKMPIAVERLRAIEEVTQIPREQLRPDLFSGFIPAPSTGAA